MTIDPIDRLAEMLDAEGFGEMIPDARWPASPAMQVLQRRGLTMSFDPEVGDVATHVDVVRQLLAPFLARDEAPEALVMREGVDADDRSRILVTLELADETRTISGPFRGGKWLDVSLVAGVLVSSLELLGHDLVVLEDRSVADQCVYWVVVPDEVADFAWRRGLLDPTVVFALDWDIIIDVSDGDDEEE